MTHAPEDFFQQTPPKPGILSRIKELWTHFSTTFRRIMAQLVDLWQLIVQRLDRSEGVMSLAEFSKTAHLLAGLLSGVAS